MNQLSISIQGVPVILISTFLVYLPQRKKHELLFCPFPGKWLWVLRGNRPLSGSHYESESSGGLYDADFSRFVRQGYLMRGADRKILLKVITAKRGRAVTDYISRVISSIKTF